MKRYFPAALIAIVLAATLAGLVLAAEEAGEATAETAKAPEPPGKTLKLVTATADEEELLEKPDSAPPFEPDAEVRKMEVMIPIFGMTIPIIFLVVAAAVVIVAVLLAHRTALKRYEVLQVAIKEGRELPPDIFRNGHRRRRDPLFSGLVLVALGIAVSISVGAVSGWIQAVWGLIPLFIGLAFLIYVPFYRKQKKEDENQ
jgi:hypothetical protein